MIAIILHAHFYKYIPLICIIFMQICASNCNVIPNNKDVIERRVVGSVKIGSSDSRFPIDEKNGYAQTMTKPILRHQSSNLDPLIAFPPMPHKDNAGLLLHSNIMAGNHKPLNQNPYNIYNIPFEEVLNDPSKNYYSLQQKPPHDLTENIFEDPLKKYDLKKFFLKKILGEAYEEEEGHKDGFFGGQHLRRHGVAGKAAKVFGELIGIKIREMIEKLGKTISGYAKDFTTRSFVSIGNTFSKVFKV